MKKKVKKILIVIGLILLVVGFLGYRIFYGPSVSIKERRDVKEYVINYLTKTYGDHKYRVSGISYEYDMTTLFDYSNPTGYWVYFKSDVVSHSWVTITGLNPDDYKIDSDYFIESYYFPDHDGYDVYNKMSDMIPREQIETILLNELKDEFEPNAVEVECDYILLSVPENYGKIPTLEELKTNVDLYEILGFDYSVLYPIKDTVEYEERLKEYILNKYKTDSNIYFYKDNTHISIHLDN